MTEINLFARRSIEAIIVRRGSAEIRLSAALGPLSLIGLGVGAVIGAGIFVLTGTAAARYAGPAIIVSFALAGVACAIVALCYAELAALMPVSGSTYSYVYATLGEIFAWVIGWDLILEYAMGASTVAVGWSGYLVSLLASMGIVLPPALTSSFGADIRSGGSGIFNVPAAAIVLALTGLLVLGTRESARANNIMVVFKLAVVLAVIVFGASHISRANWTPFLPANTGEFGQFGWSGVLRGAAVVFFAYIGFDAVSTAAQETEHPQRDVPIGLLGSLTICTILYVVVAAVVTGVVSYTRLDTASPIAVAVDAIGIGWLAILVKIAALAGLTTVILVTLFGQSRILFAMAEDGFLPPLFARLHPRFQTPAASQIAIGLAVAAVAGLAPIDVLAEMVSIGTLLAFALVCVAVLYLRRTRPDLARPFLAPAVPMLPALGILACLGLMAGLPGVTWLRLIVWLVAGLAIYFAYGRRHVASINASGD